MDNEYHSHWWNLIIGSTLYLNVIIKHLFVKTQEAPFGNTDTFSGIFKVNQALSNTTVKLKFNNIIEWSLISQGLTSKSNTHFESIVQSFSFPSTDKCDYMVKLPAELFTSKGRDFDEQI